MVWFVFGVIFAIAGVICFFYRFRLVAAIAALLAAILIIISLGTVVPTGFTGVLTTFGKVEDRAIEAGLNLKAPWQDIVLMDNREQKVPFNFSAFSSDIQQTNVVGSINFNINKQTSMTLYRDIGTNYVNVLISPRVLENTKTVFSRYSAEQLISKRDVLATEIEELMRLDVEEYGINVISISIEDIDFSDVFTNAIEAKTVAAQEKLRAETQQEQMTMEAQAAADRQKIQAEAEAEVAKVKANADAYAIEARAAAEAEANKKIAQSLTNELIQYTETQQWDGKLPSYMGQSSSAIPIIDIE